MLAVDSEVEQSFLPITSGVFARELTEQGCIDTANCISICKNFIEGSVAVDGSPLNSGYVELLDVDSNIVSSINLDVTGGFIFENLCNDSLIVLATVTGTSAAEFSPTYYFQSRDFQDAEIFELDYSIGGVDIDVLHIFICGYH